MAKIQSTVFVVLLVFATCHQSHASPFNKNMTDVVHSIKDQIVDLVDKTTKEVRDSLDQLTELVQDTFTAAKEVANNSQKKITDEYNQVLDRVNSIMSENDILTEECRRAVEAFKLAYSQLIDKTNDCVNSRISSGVANLDKIKKHAEEILEKLNHLKDEAVDCTKAISGPGSFLQALKCVNGAGFKAAWLVGQKVPAVTLEVGKLGANILILPPQIGYCFSTQFISVVGSNYKETMKKVRQCIVKPHSPSSVPFLGTTTTQDPLTTIY